MSIEMSLVREKLLEVIKGMSANGTKAFDRYEAMRYAAQQLGVGYDEQQHRVVLDVWDDLFRAGVVSLGLNLSARPHASIEWAHLTAHGSETMRNLSRDPSNPSGYRLAIDDHLRDYPVAASYVYEAVETYNRNCMKAAAVMLGAAAESLNLALRDKLTAKMTARGQVPPQALGDWRIARVVRAIDDGLTPRMNDMPRDLRERFESFWPAWTGLFRMTRNDAGHPTSVDPVTRDAVHAALLLFHEQARLCKDLSAWVDASY